MSCYQCYEENAILTIQNWRLLITSLHRQHNIQEGGQFTIVSV